MTFLRLALKSLKNRLLATSLTVLSISLSIGLLLTVERAQRATEQGFNQTISKTDLIVGARSGPLQLVLYTVFNIGNATHNISYSSYQEISKHPAIAWTIPYSLGDGHRGYRVVGTNQDFFKHYHFRKDQKVSFSAGRPFQELFDVVIGAEVARQLQYKMGQNIVVSHGVTNEEGFQHHDDLPFRISGIMAATGTPLDRAVYISLEAMEALHLDHTENLQKEKIEVDAITSFFVGTHSKLDILKLQREINGYTKEPVLAIIPGVALAELWEGLSYAEGILRLISLMVLAVGFMAMLIALTTTLNERRREMAILRAVGAQSKHILGLLVFESALLTLLGVVGGVVLSLGLVALLAPWIETKFGLYLAGAALTQTELLYILGALAAGTIIGLIPAFKAQNQALKDGLSVKV